MPKHLKRYSWPSSKIDRDLIHELHMTSKATGRPITALIAEAVQVACNARFEQAMRQPMGFVVPQQAPQSAA